MTNPALSASLIMRLRLPRGSPGNGFPLGRYTSQTSRATLPYSLCHGMSVNVSRSGFRYMSDSSILTKPSMDEPSNMTSPSSAFSSWLTGSATFLVVPMTSVNWSLTNSTLSCSALSRTACFVILLIGKTLVLDII
ncbi:MAG: hypothetical protein A4E28_01677 [Methanocella sp. PtaU1.Bin125]|nr:MAG: hypothetical protein A4E28_01677 [Methanocella sp. PtaU1.Bin125]